MFPKLMRALFRHNDAEDNRQRLDALSAEADAQRGRMERAARVWDERESFVRGKLGVNPDRVSWNDLLDKPKR